MLGRFTTQRILIGLLLTVLAAVEVFALVLLVVAMLGAAMAAVDALEWVLLQASVEDEYRGRVIGAWNLAIGLGWVGPILLGGVAEAMGVQSALALFGGLLLMTGLIAGTSRALRSV